MYLDANSLFRRSALQLKDRTTELFFRGTPKTAKHRMIREVVQNNLENPFAELRRRRLRWHILRWAPLVTVPVILLVFSVAAWRSKVSAGHGVSPQAATIQHAAEQQTAEPQVPETPPANVSLSVLPLSIRRIVIDAGHGGDQAGAISNTGLAEKDVTLDIALRLRRLLKESPFEVLLTRETDQTVTLGDRVKFANSSKADLFISIHINWMEPRSIQPLETFYVGPSKDPHVLKLATIENRGSGYSLSQYRELLEKVYLDVRRNESQAFATSVDVELYKSLRPLNPKLDNRGVKMAPFAVLVGTQMPAVLAEVSSLSNDEDDKLLRDDQYKEKIAAALFEGITRYAKHLNNSGKRSGTRNGTT